MRVIAALMACGGMTFADPSANAQVTVPCRYEVAHIIQGPICPITQQPALTVGTAISPSGRYVCGYYRLCGPSEDSPFVFDTTTQAFFTIPLPSGFYAASCADVNDAGLVVGSALRTNVGQRGFIYRMETGEWTELLPQPGGVWSAATGVNSSDTVCGWRSIGPGTHPQTAFRWTLQSGFEDLGLINGQNTTAADLNDASTVTGWMIVNNVLHAYLWMNGEIIDLDALWL